jgi:hypothetical protein
LEGAEQAVVFMVMSLFDVSNTLLTVVVGVNGLVVYMQRRHDSHRQIAGQQQKRSNMSQKQVHLSGCKNTIFFAFDEKN